MSSDCRLVASANVKLATFVPIAHANAVRSAMKEAGAGTIGAYVGCSFSTEGDAKFTPLPDANPTIGSAGFESTVREVRVETVCDRSALPAVIAAIRKSHPYNTPGIEIYGLLELLDDNAG